MILASLAFILQPALTARQEPDWEAAAHVPAIVKRALHQQPHWRYTGTRTVTLRRKNEPVTYTEYVTRDGWNLRIEYPAASRYGGQIIVETQVDRRHFDAKKNEIHITPPRREPLFEHIRGGWRGDHPVDFTESAGDRIAGLPTRLVKVSDEKGNRLQEINIEPRTGVVLAYRWFDKVGTPLGSFEYSEIDLHPNIDPSVFVLRRNGAQVTTPEDELKKTVANTGFLPLVLPASTGLQLDSAHIHQIAGQSVLISQYAAPKGRVFLFQLAAGIDPDTLEKNAPKRVHFVALRIQGRWFVLAGPLAETKLRETLSTLERGP
jgi:hypothetical protein